MTQSFFDSVKENDSSSFPKTNYFKFQEGKNKVLILSNPVHFRTAYNIGIVYHGADYNDIASSKYLCYVKDFKDNTIKLMEFSHTVAKALTALGEGYYTKFDSFPMPYAVQIDAVGAGKPTVKYSVIALEPIELSEAEKVELEALDSADNILERKKDWQKKEMETNPEYAEKAGKAAETARDSRNKSKDKSDKKENIETISYDDIDDSEFEGIIPEDLE